MTKEQRRHLVLDYFARGGTIHRLPTPEHSALPEILEYFENCDFVVYPAPRGDGQPKYVYQGTVVTLEKLVSIANEHRAMKHLRPFQLVHH